MHRGLVVLGNKACVIKAGTLAWLGHRRRKMGGHEIGKK